jgi:hypothetical protein
MLQQSNYGPVLFGHETGDAAATNLLADFLQTGRAIPFIGSAPGPPPSFSAFADTSCCKREMGGTLCRSPGIIGTRLTSPSPMW